MSEIPALDKLFKVFELPPLSSISDLRNVISDFRETCRYRYLSTIRLQTASGIELQVQKGANVDDCYRFLKEYADTLSNQLNRRINDAETLTPANPLTLVWPPGTMMRRIQQGTAMVQGAIYELEGKRIAYVSDSKTLSSNHVRLQEGFAFEKDGNTLRVVEKPPTIEDGDDGTYIVYPKAYWSKSAAWDDVRRRYSEGGRFNNPWTSNHHSGWWSWHKPKAKEKHVSSELPE
jgi:hypothetical protein